MELIDTHCHLQFDSYISKEDEFLSRASQAGVKSVICVGTTLSDSEKAVKLAKTKHNVWASTGVHPHDAASFLADASGSKKLRKLGGQPRVVAIGETGLDYYRQISAKTEQQRALRAQIEASLELDLPLIFHVRDAWADFWPIFDSYKNLRGVIHSFSSHTDHLDEVLARGLYVGLNGIMTFTKDLSQLEAARAVPLDRLLLETDAPFLTPAPFRGELCEPKHVATIAEFLANLREQSIDELSKATTDNAVKLFKLN